MTRTIADAKEVLSKLSNNHSQWIVQCATTKKAHIISKSYDFYAKFDKILSILTGSTKNTRTTNTSMNSVLDVEDVNFIARTNFNNSLRNNGNNFINNYRPNNFNAKNINFGQFNNIPFNLENVLNQFISSQKEQKTKFDEKFGEHSSGLWDLTIKVALSLMMLRY